MWYREGTITFTQGSNTLVGAGTAWNVTANGVLPGMIVIGPDNKLYEIKRVISDTNIVLSEPYTGETQSEVPCRIITTYEGDLTQFSARFTALMSRMSADSKSMRSWLTALDEVTIEREDGTEVTVKPLMQIVNEHNENVEWYKNNTDAIDAAGDKAREAAASAAAAAESANTAGEKASQASQSASAAASSQSAASASATAAKKSETNAAASQQSAATSASTATTKASEAATSARDAAASKEAAKSSETNASLSASSAASSATAAANSAKAAKTSETNAKSSETAAGQSASAAAGSKTAAASSASAASTSAGQASASATAAGKSAESAASSASTATTKAGEATEQASAAARSASAAKTSETNAKASETSAESSKTAAASSASSAASSASSASASKDEATRQASAAKGSATTASTKATEAAGSATAAAQSKSTAESAATRAETAAKRAEDIASAVALEDASTTKKGIVQLSSATNSTSETLAATPKAVKAANDNANSRLAKNQNGADIPDKARFLSNINAASKTDMASKRGMKYSTVNAPAGVEAGKFYPVVIRRSSGFSSELASRVTISTSSKTANDRMNNCEFNGFVMPGGWTDRGHYAYGMFHIYHANERAIHSIMMGRKADDLCSVFYVEGEAFPIAVYVEEGLSVVVPSADYVIGQSTYKWGATDPRTECVDADTILDFSNGRGFYSSHALLTNADISGNKVYANDEVIVRSQNALRMIAGDYGVIWRNDGANTYLLMTDKGDQYGGWNGLRPFAVNNATGEVTINTPLNSPKGVKGNSDTATKLQTARKISGVPFDGSTDITLTAAHVAAFARRATGSYADADGGVPWNAESGAYNVNRTGDSYILANFYTGVGSCRTLQIKAHYKNGGLFYRSSRDGYGFESGWEQVYTTGFRPQPADINAPTAADGWLNSGNGTAFTTAQFITWLNNQGAFSNKYWIARCSWYYANNNYIDDTGCGRIDLSGSVIEVFSNKTTSNYTIRVTTTTTSGHGGVNNAEFIYVYNGSDYSPGWRRSYNTRNKPTASDVGALSLSGGALTGGLTAAGEIISKSANGLRIAYGNYGFFIRNDGSSTYFMLTDSGNSLGTYNSLRPLIINNANGAVTIGNGLNVTGGINGSLNGNASTATKLQTARNINGVKFDGSGDININTLVSRGRVTALSGSTQGTAGIQMYEAYNNSYPTTYGNVLHMKGASAAGEGELLIGWSGTDGAHAPVYVRSRRDTSTANWSGWAQIYTTAHKPTAADVGALPSGGGTLSGSLAVSMTAPNIQLRGQGSDTRQYIMGYRTDGATSWYVGKANNGSDSAMLWNYTGSNGIELAADGNVRINAKGKQFTFANNGNLGLVASLDQSSVPQGTYHQVALNAGTVGGKSYLRKFRGGNTDTIWHETVQGGLLRWATGNTDAQEELSISTGYGVRARGEITSLSANGLRVAYGNYGFFIRNDGGTTYFMLTASGDKFGSWNALRPMYINNASGAVTMGNGLSLAGGLNVTSGNIRIPTSSTSWIDMRNNAALSNSSAVATSSASAIIRQEHADRHYFVGGLGNSQFGFYMINKSRTANGTDANAYLQNDGTWVCGGNGSFNDVYIRSDRRSKRNIRKIDRALDKLEQIEGVLYEIQVCGRYEQSGGLIAQDVQNVQPELVTVDHNDQSGEPRLRLNYNGVIGMLVEAVKELREEVRELKAKM
ncbi:putative tail fiber protein (GpH) [Shigella sonnei]|nr:putative tail fiber protein (GpH) [Shigella sonnei]